MPGVSSAVVAAHIRFLLDTLDSSGLDSVFPELCQIVEYGTEESILLLQAFACQVNFHEGDSQIKVDLFSDVVRYMMDRPNFSTIFSEAFGNMSIDEGFLRDLSKMLRLSALDNICIGLAAADSLNLDLKNQGHNFCTAQIEELFANSSVIDFREKVHDIVFFLSESQSLSKYVDSFTNMLSLVELNKHSRILSPMLPDAISDSKSLRQLDLLDDFFENEFDSLLSEIEKELSVADVMKELGYGCTFDESHCQNILSLSPLNEVTLSRVISTLAQTYTGLNDNQNMYSTFCTTIGSGPTPDLSCLTAWNIDALVNSINLLAPQVSWMAVMENLDHEGFYIPDESSFHLLMSIYRKACEDPFPLHAISGSVWKNAKGQLSFLRYAVSASPETFTFAHSSRKMAAFTVLSGTEYQACENEAWRCLDLLEVLCQLAENGHTSCVRKILEYPIQHCPGILLIGLAYLTSDFNFLQNEVSCLVFPALLHDANINDTFSILWNLNPNLVLLGFINVHITDPDSMIKIHDICLELKILSSVLERAPFSFSIKLAIVASKKETIDFEKWLNQNIHIYKYAFYAECFSFWKEMSKVAAKASSDEHRDTTIVGKVYVESCPIFIKVLQAIEQPMAQELVDELKQLPISIRSINLVASDGSSGDVDADANSYFHQMFSEKLSVDAMVQMLARFKDSTIEKEKLIFDCIISYIFEEYKFYPKYPERQLKIAAVLFGSVIKHKLVVHLTLGMALRKVLDALRKSVDSKMFLFGVTALEQFIDRLVEWPQYCNHILQISHLRSTRPELVNFIERALARVSSGQVETAGVNNATIDQNQVSTLQDNIEASEASWQLVNSEQVSQPVLPPNQQQSKHQGLLDDRQKAIAPVSYAKPFVTSAAQPLVGTLNADSINNSQKGMSTQPLPGVPSQTAANGPLSVPVSPGLFRSSRALTPSGIPRQPSYNTGFGSALNIETLVAAADKRDSPIDAPGSDIQDKIFFMINNISVTNLEGKAKDFIDILKEHYYPWFAQYMVMKRASIEPNFHDLYLKFLDKVNSRSLNQEIVKVTYENCKVLLRSELIKSSVEERSLLKNLGSWLGKFTIGRNQALRGKEIDPKLLIIEAYEKGLMIAVIPFTSKILEPCQSSMAYKPPNPWTMGILSLLAEISALPNLKMNIKFDIEVLFKNLGVDMKDAKPTSLLKDRPRDTEGNPDFSTKDLVATQPNSVSDGNAGVISALNQVELQPEITSSVVPSGPVNALSQYNNAPIHLPSSSVGEDEKLGPLNLPEQIPSGLGLSAVSPHPSYQVGQLATAVPNIGGQVVVNNKLDSLGINGRFQRIIQVALDRAVKDIMPPIVGRSVKVATNTAMELVLKDFAVEADDKRIYSSARFIVASLAGSLAHVTCKELLRSYLSSHIKSMIHSINASGEYEQAIQLMTNDNLDLGCAVIEQTATEKAILTIDGELAAQLSQRKKTREEVGSQFYDASKYTQGSFARVPESLRPKPGRLSPTQMRVYEDFIRIPWQNQSAQNSTIMPSGVSGQPSVSTNPGLSRVFTSSGINNAYPAAQVVHGFGPGAQQIDFMPEEIDHGSANMSSSTSLIGINEGGLHLSVDVNTTNPPFNSALVPMELRQLETSSVAHESGTYLSSSAPSDRSMISLSEPSLTTGDALDKYLIVAERLDSLIAKDAADTDMQEVIAELPEILLKCNGRDEAALAVAQRVFQRLYENASNRVHVASYILLLVSISDVCKLVVKELTNWVIYSSEERKLNKDITIALIRSGLVNLAEFDAHLAKLIDGGRNKSATDFAVFLVKTLVIEDSIVSSPEFYNIIDALTKLALRPGSPESLQQLFESAKNPSASSGSLPYLNIGKDDKSRQAKDILVTSGSFGANRDDLTAEPMVADPTGFRDQVSSIFNEWCQNCEHPAATDASRLRLISQLHQGGLLKGDDTTDWFFRILMELSLARCLSTSEVNNAGVLSFIASQQVQFSFVAIDMFEKLIVSILKFCVVEQASTKTNFLSKILGVMVRTVHKDADEKKSSFNPRPHFRLFVYLLLDLNSSDPVFDGFNFIIMTSFANAFHALQPLRVPSFSFAWLELISHRSFMPKLLMAPAQKGWPFVQRLLVDLFKFMEPYLRSAELVESVQHLYRGTLRVLLVLLHDFPEFLCDYHFSFCDVIPASCIQMRNVILSAFPRNMRLPDPSTPNLKIDLLAEISQSPNILSEVDAALKSNQLKLEIDDYLKTRQGSTLMADLKLRLLLPQNEAAMAGTRYNVPLINSLVLYVGMQAIQQMQNKSPPPSQMSHALPMDIFLASAAMDVYKSLVRDLNTEGRYLVLNAIANQLRYPNNHTHYFSFVLLYLFAEANQDVIQEQITRVLFERLVLNRPHPWGLLITFIELVKNPRYDFWSRPFTRCTPELQSFFENISRSCGPSKVMDDGMVSGGI